MKLDNSLNRNDLKFSRVLLCFITCLFAFYSSFVFATITTVASEQSGSTIGIIEHVGAGASASRNNSCGSISPTVPAGNVGDLLIAVAVIRENTTNVTMAGWTQYYSEYHGVDGNGDVGGYIFYKVATDVGGGGSADASPIVSTSTGAPANCRSLRGQISRFDGVDTSAMPGSAFEVNPIAAGNSSTQNTANVTTGTNTTTVATAMSIAVTFINDNATVTEGDGFSESFDFISAGGRNSSMSLNYRQEVSTGTKGAFTWPQNLGTDESIGVLFALKPDNTIEGIGVNVPAGTSTNDVMVAAIAVGSSSTGIIAPAGWTLINRVDQGAGNTNSRAVYYRIATATEPSAYVWSFSGGTITGTAGGVITYRGVDTTTPIDASGGNVTASSTSHTANSIVTTVDNTMVVSTHSFSSSQTWTEPAGMTEHVDVASLVTPNGAGISLEMNDVTQAAAGATGNKTAIAAGSADTGVAQIVALTPLLVSNNITVTFAGGPIERILGGSISVTDAALGTPELSVTNVNVADSAAITTNIGPTLTNNALLIDIVGKPRGNHTYNPGAGQTERWDNELGNNNNGAAGAMSTKQVSAASDSMAQTHTSGTRRNAHVVASIAPFDSSSTATFDAAASATANSSSSLGWTHTLATSNLINTKVVVGVTYRMTAACGGASITGITYGSLSMTQIAATSVSDGTRCQYSELWYVDLTNIIVSTDNNSNLGGQAIDQDEAVEYDASTDTGSLFFDDATFDSNARLDALHQYDNGNIAVSVAGNGEAVGGNSITNGSVALLTSTGTTGVYNFSSILFDESNFASGDETIDAVYARDNGNIVLSTNNNANLPGVGIFSDDDIVEWNPTTNTATLIFDISSITGAANSWDVDGVHFLNDDENLILFSLYSDRTIGSTTYENGDVLLYNRNTSTLSIYFSEDNFTGNEDVDALTLAIGVIDPPVLKNFVLTASTTASTCTSTEITIEAINTDDALFDYDGTITLNTTTGNGNWDEVDHDSNLSATNPATNAVVDVTADDGQATYLFAGVSDGGRVGLFLSNDHAETLQVTVSDISVPGTATSVNITFSDNVFEITPTTCTGTSCPGTGSLEVVAGREHVFQVEMVRNDGTSCGVAAGYDSNPQTLKGWIVRDGTDDPGGVLPTLAEQTAALGNGAAPSADNVNLDFSAGGTATLTLQTTDVGEFELFLRDDTNGFAAVDIDGSTGATDNITVRPFGIDFSNINGAPGPANPGATMPGGTVFVSAGSNFSATIGGYLYDAGEDSDSDGVPNAGATLSDNGVTPAFDWPTTITVNKNTPTHASSVTGTLNNGSVALGEYSSGEYTVPDLQYLEVGSITLDSSVTDYLNDTNVDMTQANGITLTSEIIGKFYADHFEFTVNTTPIFAAACNNFTYVDQLFTFSNTPLITVSAASTVATGSSLLQNYHDFTTENWWRLDFDTGVSPVYSDGSTPADISLVDTSDYSPSTGTSNSGTTGTFSQGTKQFTLSGSFEYDDRGTAPYGPKVPFNSAMQLAFTVTDSDSATGTQTINPITFASGNSEQRWGRFVIGTGTGSELLPVSVQFEAQYYDATSTFVVNTDDTCTALTASSLLLTTDPVLGEGTQIDGDILINNTTCTGTGIATGTVTSPPGDWGLSFAIAAPASACDGYVDIDIDLSASDWLQYDWSDTDDADDDPYNENPTGRVDFGIFEGPNTHIYIREPW